MKYIHTWSLRVPQFLRDLYGLFNGSGMSLGFELGFGSLKGSKKTCGEL